MKAVVVRNSRSSHVPIASGAVLVELEQATQTAEETPLIAKVSKLLIDARLRNDKELALTDFEACKDLSAIAPKSDVDWEDVEGIDDFRAFLKQSIFRLDED